MLRTVAREKAYMSSRQLRIRPTTASDSEGVNGASRQQTVTPTHHHSAVNDDCNTDSRGQHSFYHHAAFYNLVMKALQRVFIYAYHNFHLIDLPFLKMGFGMPRVLKYE